MCLFPKSFALVHTDHWHLSLYPPVNERTRKLRSQYTQQSHALKQRIEMRINRIPKKLWKITMADLLAQAEGRDLANSIAIVGGAKGFVDDIRRLRLIYV